MIEKLLCGKNKTLLDALQKININTKGTIFAVDSDKKLCGILTDGDIRRLLLDGHSLQEKIARCLKKDFVYAKKGEKHDEIIKKISRKIYIIPVIDDNGRVIDYAEYRSDIHFPIVSPHLRGNELKYLIEAFLSTWISSSGEYIEKFGKRFSAFCGCKYGIPVSNGTVALHLALLSLGIGQGDEVIVPDLTFAATINAVFHSNATPVIVDVEKNSWCIDPERIEKAITPRTKAIIPVHLYGQPCDMESIMRVAKRHNLFVIEDCAQAHGATFDGKKVGSFGDIACFSFFGNKIITTGEGGMCLGNNEKVIEKIKILRDHGMASGGEYKHDVVGYNYRMTNLQAAIGIAQLERIDQLLQMRKEIENLYREKLKDVKWLLPQPADLARRAKVVWYISYLVNGGRIAKNDLMEKLKKHGIETRPFFWPLSKMKIYEKFADVDCPVADEISSSGINFPTNLNLPIANYQSIFPIIKSIGKRKTT